MCFYKNSQQKSELNPSCISCDKQMRALWRDRNRDRIKKVTSEYRSKNVKYYTDLAVKVNKKRRDNVLECKLEHNYRGLIHRALKDNYRSGKSHELLGCSIESYKEYMMSLFKEGMTWENRGKVWQIDHITPIKNYDMKDYEQVKKAFNFRNTQALFKSEHKQKTFIDNKSII